MPLAESSTAAGVLWAHADVSERREQHRLLALRNRALNAMSDGIFIADPAGSVMYANQGLARLTGRPQEALTGQPWTLLLVRSRTPLGSACRPCPALCRQGFRVFRFLGFQDLKPRAGTVMYANQGLARLTGRPQEALTGQPWTLLLVRPHAPFPPACWPCLAVLQKGFMAFSGNPAGSFMYANQGLARLTGRPQEALTGQPWTLLLVRSFPISPSMPALSGTLQGKDLGFWGFWVLGFRACMAMYANQGLARLTGRPQEALTGQPWTLLLVRPPPSSPACRPCPPLLWQGEQCADGCWFSYWRSVLVPMRPFAPQTLIMWCTLFYHATRKWPECVAMRVPEQAEEADWGAANAVADAMAAGQPASAELLLRTAAGGHLWAQVRACAHPHNPTPPLQDPGLWALACCLPVGCCTCGRKRFCAL